MSNYKLVPVEPTLEMVVAAEDAYMPFGDMEMALRMALLAAPDVQGEPVTTLQVSGIGRDASHPRAVILYLRSEPTDDDIRTIQDALRAGCAQPAEQKPAPDVAQLVEALESAKNLIANHSGEALPAKYAGDQIEQIDAALAAHRKGE